jgi:hypothetical protein
MAQNSVRIYYYMWLNKFCHRRLRRTALRSACTKDLMRLRLNLVSIAAESRLNFESSPPRVGGDFNDWMQMSRAHADREMRSAYKRVRSNNVPAGARDPLFTPGCCWSTARQDQTVTFISGTQTDERGAMKNHWNDPSPLYFALAPPSVVVCVMCVPLAKKKHIWRIKNARLREGRRLKRCSRRLFNIIKGGRRLPFFSFICAASVLDYDYLDLSLWLSLSLSLSHCLTCTRSWC